MISGDAEAWDNDDGFGPRLTALSDLSANVFAALLLILIILLQIQVAGGRSKAGPPAAPRQVEATRDLALRTRAPLSPRALVSLLRARDPATPGLSVDLTQRGIVFPATTDGNASTDPVARLQTALQQDRTGPVRLYVFSHRWYGRVADLLQRAGRPWTELSVPIALRSSDPGGAWSEDFLALVGSEPSDTGFRTGLAQLLARSPAPLSRFGHVSGEPDVAMSPTTAGSDAPLSSGLVRIARAVLAWVAVLFGVGTIVGVEFLVPRRQFR